MRLSHRPLTLALFGGLALLGVACAVSDRGRTKEQLVGKWKVVSLPGADESKMQEMLGEGAYMYTDFGPSGTMTSGIVTAKGTNQVFRMMKYEVLEGNEVVISRVGVPKDDGKDDKDKDKGKGKDKGNERVTVYISDDTMTVTGPKGTTKYTRIK